MELLYAPDDTKFPYTMQLLMFPKYTPPPNMPAELPLSVQLFSVLWLEPPPVSAELPLSVQLFSVPSYIPPPNKPAELPLSTQLLRMPLPSLKGEKVSARPLPHFLFDFCNVPLFRVIKTLQSPHIQFSVVAP